MTIADIGLLGSTDDATVWAKEFMKVVRHRWDGGTLPVNKALMEEWFGNLVVVAHRRANPHYYDGLVEQENGA